MRSLFVSACIYGLPVTVWFTISTFKPFSNHFQTLNSGSIENPPSIPHAALSHLQTFKMSNNEQPKTYKQQAGEFYNKQYESWMPWVEDKYLSWFTKDNKASYATKRMSTLP